MPGRAKTRLIPALGAAGAAALHERMCHAALALATAAPLAPVQLWCHPDARQAFFSLCHARYGVELHEQYGADLGARLRHAFDHALESSRYAIVIGTDCPGLTEDDLRKAFRALENGGGAVLGPASDGGYVLIGLSRPAPALFADIDWGSGRVLAQTRARLADLGLRTQELPPRHDIDRPEDLVWTGNKIGRESIPVLPSHLAGAGARDSRTGGIQTRPTRRVASVSLWIHPQGRVYGRRCLSETKCGVSSTNPGDQVRVLYTALAQQPERNFGWEKGKGNAQRLGYDPAWLARLPDCVWESAAAVGNPFAIGPLHPGETVVDIGCGAGADLCIAALLVGATGQAIGLDLTPAMVAKARVNAQQARLHNVTAHEANIENPPLSSVAADVVISNGAINLAPDKARVFREIHRILRPGGRLQFADMVRRNSGCDTITKDGSWADCVAGTLPPEQYLELLQAAGFGQIEFVSWTGYRTASDTEGASFRAVKVSIVME